MDNHLQWITIGLACLGLFLTVVGAVFTLFTILLGFIVRRLTKTIDSLVASMDEMKLALVARPMYDASKHIAEEAADVRTIVHENEKH